MKKMVFKFRTGAPFPHKKAQAIGERLETIRKSHKGRLSPDDIVSDAYDGNSPLHTVFEWNDVKAAHVQRMGVARNLVGAVVVEYEELGGVEARYYVSTRTEESTDYIPTTVALSDPKIRVEILEQAMGELTSFQTRYKHLNELAMVFSAINKVKV